MTTAPPTDHVADDHPAAPPVSKFVLPPSSGQRVRRQRLARRARRATLFTRAGASVAIGIVVVLAAVTLIRRSDTTDIRTSATRPEGTVVRGGTPSAASTTAVESVPVRTALVVVPAADGTAGSITFVATRSNGRGGALLFLPPGALVTVPSIGTAPLGVAFRLGGPPLLLTTVENLLGVAVSQVITLDAAALTAVTQNAGPLRVNVPERVLEADPDGTLRVAYDAGPNTIAPAGAETFWRVAGTGSDIARLDRQRAYWRAWLTQLRESPNAFPNTDTDRGLRPFLQTLAAGTPTMDVLPVDAISGSGQAFRVSVAAVDTLVQHTLAFAGASVQPRLPIEILNGSGIADLAGIAASRVVAPPLRARIVSSGDADRADYPATQIAFSAPAARSSAEQVQDALGVGQVIQRKPSDESATVSVVIGRDFR